MKILMWCNTVLQQRSFQHWEILLYFFRLTVPIRSWPYVSKGIFINFGSIGQIKNIPVFSVFSCSPSMAAIIHPISDMDNWNKLPEWQNPWTIIDFVNEMFENYCWFSNIDQRLQKYTMNFHNTATISDWPLH